MQEIGDVGDARLPQTFRAFAAETLHLTDVDVGETCERGHEWESRCGLG
jgi:hypothetical protein